MTREEELDDKKEHIQSILNINPKGKSSSEIRYLISNLEETRSEVYQDKELFEFKEDLNQLISKSKDSLNKVVYNEEISAKKEELEELDEVIEMRKKEKKQLDYLDKENKRKLLSELETYENPVFKKEDLTEDQIEALLEDKYVQTNEYCVNEQKIITVLVKPPMNHSTTHTFLVWSTMNLLDKFPGVEKLIDHETVEADITFRYKGKIYAIEIETGNLLRKKMQKQNKIKFLNRKYKGRWLIVVSNRNLLKEYNKLGPASERKRVTKKLKKMLGN